jgi:hypothetical protein
MICVKRNIHFLKTTVKKNCRKHVGINKNYYLCVTELTAVDILFCVVFILRVHCYFLTWPNLPNGTQHILT